MPPGGPFSLYTGALRAIDFVVHCPCRRGTGGRCAAAVMSEKPLPALALVTLGCHKNLVDSERMLACLALDGFAITADPDGADVAIVNTCGFIDVARAESDRHIDALEAMKRDGRLGHVVVAGCMAQRYGREILERHGDVDAVVGLAERDGMAEVCRRILDGRPVKRKRNRGRSKSPRKAGQAAVGRRPVVRVGPPPSAVPDDRERLRLTPRHYAYLRITEGCDNRCAYCAIPAIRGRLRSKPAARVLEEAEELVADGAKELVVIGQDTTAYGHDRRAKGRGLAGLLADLCERSGARWIRLMYAHPASIPADLIDRLAAGLPLVPYLDLPIQHITTRILESMGRRVGRTGIENLIDRLRAAVPHLAIRTSLIVGYPGETDDDFEHLVTFVEKVRFDHVGVFVYSPEEGTRAAGLPGRVAPEVGRQRWERLMAAAETLAHEAAAQHVGQTIETIVDGADAGGRLTARHAGQAPEVDSAVLLPAGAAQAGEFCTVRVTGTDGYDLVADVVTDGDT